MILTPDRIDDLLENWHDDWNPWEGWDVTEGYLVELMDTLRAYASIVERVAEMNTPRLYGHADWCVFCHASLSPLPRDRGLDSGHAPDCLYLEARKLRGKE